MSQNCFEFKSSIKVGSFQTNFKIPICRIVLVNHAESNYHKRIPVNENLGFHKKVLISQICFNEYMQAKRVPQAGELSAVYANHVNLIMV